MVLDKNIPRYNLGYVIRETDIQADTLRAWERRYGVPSPQRSEGGHRLYSERDIETLRWLMQQQKEGLSISKAVDLLKELQTEGKDPLTLPGEVPPAIVLETPDIAKLREEWIDAARNFDNARSDHIMSIAFANYPIKVVLAEVLQKGLVQIGDQWYRGKTTIQQEHFCSELAIRRLHALIAAAPAPLQPDRILIALPAGEEHEVAPLMLALLLRYAGWDVIYLGANVPTLQLETTLEQLKPRLVILSAELLPAAASLLQTARFINDRNIRLAFGGAIFNRLPELRERIPGHFIGESIEEALQVIDTLLLKNLPTPFTKELPEPYQDVMNNFQRNLPHIETVLNQKMLNSSISHQTLQEYNRYFADVITAALSLGDINYAHHDIHWVHHLIGHHKMKPSSLLFYLRSYRDTLNEVLGRSVQIITDWLESNLYQLAQPERAKA